MTQELKVYRDPKEGPCWREFYEKSEVDAVLAEKDAEIRRLKRALWLARAWRAKERQRMLPNNKEFYMWQDIERKCRAKAEAYK